MSVLDSDSPLREEEITELTKLLALTTPGPWTILGQFIQGPAHEVDGIDELVCDIIGSAGPGHEADRAFMAAARTVIPKLLREREALLSKIAVLESTKPACSEYVEGINLDCATCGYPWNEHHHAI